jgi:hypothetical protein
MLKINFKYIIYLINYFIKRSFVRKYKINNVKNYGFIINDYLITDTKLDSLFRKYGCDKGGGVLSKKLGWFPHNYGQLYDQLFCNLKNKKFNFLEVGIGSVDQNIKSALLPHCKSGASLRAFRDYFTKANIYGADIDKSILFKDKRISTRYLDQTSKKCVKDFFYSIKKKFTIIIDDGLHEFDANITLFQIGIKYLTVNGIYIIEDINEFKIHYYYEYFLKYKNRYAVNIFNIYNQKFFGKSNNFIMIKKLI